MVTGWGEHGFTWTRLVRSFGNTMSELLHLAAFVALTAYFFMRNWPRSPQQPGYHRQGPRGPGCV